MVSQRRSWSARKATFASGDDFEGDRTVRSHLADEASGRAVSEYEFVGGMWNGRRLLDRRLLDQCFEGTPQNPAYGLTWWLNREVPPALRRSIPLLRRHGLGQADLWVEQGLPADLVFAAGAGDQRLYVSREQKLVVVRQAEGILDSLFGGRTGFSDQEFLARLLLGEDAAGREL